MKHTTYNFNQNNTTIFGQIWQPKNVKAIIILVHGMGEHSSRYKNSLIPCLIENDYAIVAFDQFGHGLSKGKRGHCPNYESLLNLISFAIKKGKELFPNLPVFLYGHSLGGNLVINYSLKRNHHLKGIIATSPFLRLAFQPPKWKMIIGKLLLKILPSLTMSSELDVKAISRDLKEVKQYEEDPLVHDKVSPMYSFPIIKNGEWAIKNAYKLETTMLVLHGTGDQIIDYKASEEFCKNTKNASLKLFKDAYHELHHDLCSEAFFKTIIDWLDHKI